MRPYEVAPQGEDGEAKSPPDASKTRYNACFAACGACCCCVVVAFLLAVPGLGGSAFLRVEGGSSLDEYEVRPDGWSKFPVPAKAIDGLAMRMIFRVDARDQGIVANESHVFIPYDRQITGRFMRHCDVDPLNRTVEFGLVNWMFGANPVSLFGKKIRVGLGEKLEIVHQSGPQVNASLTQARAEMDSQWSLTVWLARKLRWIRAYLLHVSMLTSRIGTQLADAGLDLNVMSQARELARSKQGSPPGGFKEQRAEMRKAFEREARAHEHLFSMGAARFTSHDCFHFEGDNGLTLVENGAYFPRGKMLVSYRGQTTFMPLTQFGIVTGISVVEFDPESDSLEIYLAGLSQFDFFDPNVAIAPKPAFFVGPVGGESMPTKRKANAHISPSLLTWLVTSSYKALPIDYDWLWEAPGTVCPPELRESLNATILHLDAKSFVSGVPGVIPALNLVSTLTTSVNCAGPYLGGHDKDAFGYELFQGLVLGHYVFESPAATTMNQISNRNWNRQRAFSHQGHVEAEKRRRVSSVSGGQ